MLILSAVQPETVAGRLDKETQMNKVKKINRLRRRL